MPEFMASQDNSSEDESDNSSIPDRRYHCFNCNERGHIEAEVEEYLFQVENARNHSESDADASDTEMEDMSASSGETLVSVPYRDNPCSLEAAPFGPGNLRVLDK